jgi:hypothetical protein
MANGQHVVSQRALRWYFARILSDEQPPRASVQVAISSARLETELAAASVRQTTGYEWLTALESDSLDFWEPDPMIEGFAAIDDLKVLIRLRPGKAELAGPPAAEREIREHMVFVQLVPSDSDLIGEIARLGQLGDLSPLLTFVSDFPWIDFTLQAREMAKQVYADAFGE